MTRLSPENRTRLAHDRRSSTDVARDFGVHPATVDRIRKEFGTSPGRSKNGTWPQNRYAAARMARMREERDQSQQ